MVPVPVAHLQVVGLAVGAAVDVQVADIEHNTLAVGGRNSPLARVTCAEVTGRSAQVRSGQGRHRLGQAMSSWVIPLK